MPTKIEWAEETWNPVVGCTKVSTECKHCYAERLHTKRHRAWKRGEWRGAPAQYGRPFTEVQFLEDRLSVPARWRAPRAVFCCSMGDLFHEDLPARTILRILNTMEQVNANRVHAGQKPHRFMVLTKRSRRMRDILETWFDEFLEHRVAPIGAASIWFGVSVGRQEFAQRALDLASIRSPVPLVRFVSAEPLLGSLWLDHVQADDRDGGGLYNVLTGERLDRPGQQLPGRVSWVIVGGETGRGARPMHPAWVRSLRTQAHRYGAAFFFKQWGEFAPGEAPSRTPFLLDVDGQVVPVELGGTADLDRPVVMSRVGRRAAGRELDGRLYEEYPEAEEVVA